MKLGSVSCPINVKLMFRKADIPVMRVVVFGVQMEMIGSPIEGYPAGSSWAAVNAVTRMTEMKVKNVDMAPSLAIMSNVRGREPSQLTAVTAIAKATVRHARIGSDTVMVLRQMAPTRMWRA